MILQAFLRTNLANVNEPLKKGKEKSYQGMLIKATHKG
jgi:hypothetical protein